MLCQEDLKETKPPSHARSSRNRKGRFGSVLVINQHNHWCFSTVGASAPTELILGASACLAFNENRKRHLHR